MSIKKELSDLSRNNKIAMIAHTIDTAIMIIFCLLQAQAGMVKWSYVLIVSAIGFAPIIAEFIFWHKNNETYAIKHLVAIGFAIFYSIILFTTSHSMVFVFVIPMILLVSVYSDTKYIILINIGTVIESILVNVLGSYTGKFAYSGRDAAVIQVVVMILIGIYSYLTADTLRKNMDQKINNVAKANKQTEIVLNDISNLSEQLKTGIGEIHYDLRHLEETSDATKNAMQEVSSGISDTVSAVQSQMLQTESIQNKVSSVSEAASDITSKMEQTISALEQGQKSVNSLVEKVDISVSNSENAASKLQTLNTYMKEMHSITELISGIASQTSLLALNASIEAARAGEAGRGFSVVATEISNMATQTGTATANITSLIGNVTIAISEVIEVIHNMIDGIKNEKTAVQGTSESFNTIHDIAYAIHDNVELLIHNIEELKTANQVIAESIQTISGVSETVSVHADETMLSEKENADIISRISEKMQQLVNLTIE